jgi:hypothetical protein
LAVLIAVTAEGTPLLKWRTPLRPSLGPPGPALAAAGRTTGTLEAGALSAGRRGVVAGTIKAARGFGAFTKAAGRTLRTVGTVVAIEATTALKPFAALTAFTALGTRTIAAIRPSTTSFGAPFTTGCKGTSTAAGFGTTANGARRASSCSSGALVLVLSAIKTGAHRFTGKGSIGSAFSRYASSWARRLGF